MIFTEEEFFELKAKLDACEGVPELGFGYNMAEREWAISWLATRPHLLFCLGFNESRSFSIKNKDAVEDVQKMLSQAGEKTSSGFYGQIKNEVILRNVEDGQWYLLRYILGRNPKDLTPLRLFFLGLGGERKIIPVDDYLLALKSLNASESKIISCITPEIWVPPYIRRGDVLANQVSIELIEHIKNNKCLLSEVKPRDLEEIVAELLKSKGLNVDVTKATRDGGRDIIAKGEFFPGIESVMAVEVTSTQVVGIQKVAQALYRNRNFPLLMVATSGRFSSGVIKEKGLPENCMRLILSDSLTLNDWIKKY